MKKYFTEPNIEETGWLGIKGKKFARDKQKHLVLGVPIFIIAIIFSYFYPHWEASYKNFHGAIQNGYGITFVAAIGKEVLDFALFKLKLKKSFDGFVPDIIATMSVVTLLFVILSLL